MIHCRGLKSTKADHHERYAHQKELGKIKIEEQIEVSSALLPNQNVLWIVRSGDDREELQGFINQAGWSAELYKRLLSPGKTFRIQQYGDAFLLDLHLFHPQISEAPRTCPFYFRVMSFIRSVRYRHLTSSIHFHVGPG
jgi:hypothetical protein